MSTNIILTATGCKSCEEIKKRLANFNHDYRFIDLLENNEGIDLAIKYGINSVPTAIINDEVFYVEGIENDNLILSPYESTAEETIIKNKDKKCNGISCTIMKFDNDGKTEENKKTIKCN